MHPNVQFTVHVLNFQSYFDKYVLKTTLSLKNLEKIFWYLFIIRNVVRR